MVHPYRAFARIVQPSEFCCLYRCLECAPRRTASRARWRAVLAAIGILAWLGAGLAWAFVAWSYVRLSDQMLTVVCAEPRRPKEAPAARPVVTSMLPLGLARPSVIQLSDNAFVVDHTVVDHFLENQAELMRTTRIQPTTSDGMQCVRLLGLGSLGFFGFENGDCILAVNGYPLSTPEQGLEAYGQLRTSNELDVALRRRGEVKVLRYYIE